MRNTLQKTKQGFTIIEVMIVLAIAGLILAIVFFAVPQLQRNARDNQRQSAVTRLNAEIQTYGSNNQGTYPFLTTAATGTGQWQDFYDRYIGTPKVNITDPTTGNPIINDTGKTAASGLVAPINAAGTGPLPTATGVANVIYGAKCNGEGLQKSGTATATTHNYAMIIELDRTGTYYCIDNG